MQRVLVVFGTRPEAIKLAPVIKELRQYPTDFLCRVCITGQHRQMLSQVLTLFQIERDHDLNIMEERQSPSQTVASVSTQIEPVLSAEQPDWVPVQGDSATAMAVSLVAYHHRIKIDHVEAGCGPGTDFGLLDPHRFGRCAGRSAQSGSPGAGSA